jgi:hypothetical protein
VRCRKEVPEFSSDRDRARKKAADEIDAELATSRKIRWLHKKGTGLTIRYQSAGVCKAPSMETRRNVRMTVVLHANRFAFTEDLLGVWKSLGRGKVMY